MSENQQLFADLFSGCPSDWQVLPFQEAVDFQEGPGILAKDFYPAGIPLIRLKGIQGATASLDGANFLCEETVAKRWSHFRLQKGDLLLSSSASLGRVSEVDEATEGAVAYTGIIRMRPATIEVDRGYIKYFTQSSLFSEQIRMSATGSVINHFGPTHLKQMGMLVPTFPEQKAIAQILGTLDDKIELNRKTNETLEAMARALFQSWFVDFDPVRAKAEELPTGGLPDEISDLFPDSFEDSDLGEIPRGWEVAELGDCDLDIESGRRPKGGIDKNLTFGIPSIGAESIAPVGQFDFSKTKWVGNDFAEASGKGWIKNFDVALYKDGGKPGEFRPRTALYGDGFPFEKAMVNEHIFLLRSAQLGQPYLYYLFNFDLVLAQIIHKGSSKGAQPGLNQEEVRTSSFVKPEKRLLDAFNNAVEPSIKKQLLIGKQCQVLSQMRDALLPKLISGEIRIPDAERLLEEAGV
jgi:type I restriction enzyme S subunit